MYVHLSYMHMYMYMYDECVFWTIMASDKSSVQSFITEYAETLYMYMYSAAINLK